MPNVSFSPLYRPVKVSWVYPLDSDLSIIDRIQSKHARAFLRNLDTFMEAEGFSIEKGVCTQAEFDQFLQLYGERMDERGFDHLATQQWFDLKQMEGKTIEKIFIYQNHKLVGAKIITAKNFEFRSSYKANRQLPIFSKLRNASLGLVLDYLMLEEYMKRSPTLLTAGTSRNLFGVINNPGYLIFKLRMGYIPSVQNEATVFQQTTDMPEKPFWFSFLSQAPKTQQPLSLYGFGDLEQFSQKNELEKLITVNQLSDD